MNVNLKETLLALIPRFVSDEIVLVDNGGEKYEILCLRGQETEYDDPCGIMRIRSFAWLGWSWFPKQVGDIESYQKEVML